MIEIQVNGQNLTIPASTAISIESTNATLAETDLAADIVWTFQLPALPNQTILGTVASPHDHTHHTFPCLLLFDGTPLISGTLHVQSSTDGISLTCGITANAFAPGFGSRELRSNDYGPDIIISETEQTHNAGWLTFLQNSLAADSPYKFFLLAADKFYSHNDEYGQHNGHPSGLLSTDTDGQFTHYINRLFTDSNNQIINLGETDTLGQTIHLGQRIFNHADNSSIYNGRATATFTPQNGYAFAPAFRLDYVVRHLFATAGLTLHGSFLASPFIQRLYIQSLNALDGDVFQYGINTYLRITNAAATSNPGTVPHALPLINATTNQSGDSFQTIALGPDPSLSFRLLLPTDSLQRAVKNTTATDYAPEITNFVPHYQYYDEIYALAISDEAGELPCAGGYRDGASNMQKDSLGIAYYDLGTPFTYEDVYATQPTGYDSVELQGVRPVEGYAMAMWNCVSNHDGYSYTHHINTYTPLIHTSPTNCTLIPLTSSRIQNVHFADKGYTTGTVSLARRLHSVSDTYYVRLVRCRVYTAPKESPYNLDDFTQFLTSSYYGDFFLLTDYQTLDTITVAPADTPVNIFSNIMRWSDHLPDLSNADFLSALCRTFGLNLFTDPLTRTAELSFFTDTLQAASLDLTDSLIHIEHLEPTPTTYTISPTPALGKKDISTAYLEPTVPTIADAPPAIYHKNHPLFIEAENAYRRSEQIEDSSNFHHVQAGGDNRTLTAGSTAPAATATSLSLAPTFTNMRIIDEDLGAPKYLCELPLTGNSPLLDEDYTGKFDLIIMQYQGRRDLRGLGYIETANPTYYAHQGSLLTDSDPETGQWLDSTDPIPHPEYLNLAATGTNSIGQKWLAPLYNLLGNAEHYRLTLRLTPAHYIQLLRLLRPQTSTTHPTRYIHAFGLRLLPVKITADLAASTHTITAQIEAICPSVVN